jgi:hypothetical protein
MAAIDCRRELALCCIVMIEIQDRLLGHGDSGAISQYRRQHGCPKAGKVALHSINPNRHVRETGLAVGWLPFAARISLWKSYDKIKL